MSFWSGELVLRDAQDLEDLATASWPAELLFAALELDIFAKLGDESLPPAELARRCGAEGQAFGRMVHALAALGLVSFYAGEVACSTLARRYLLPGTPGYLGHSLSYRRRLAEAWRGLADAVRSGGSGLGPPEDEAEDQYLARVRAYLLAMDDVARYKSGLIAARLALGDLASPVVLDLAGGAGGIAAGIVAGHPGWRALVVDLPEVVLAAERLWDERGPDYPLPRPAFAGLDLLTDPLPAQAGGYGLVIASNIVHAYGPAEAGAILQAAAGVLAEDGLLVVHDFWTAGPGRGPAKAALFDLHMLLNTYQGRTYPWLWVRDRLESAHLHVLAPVSLGDSPGREDTALVIGARDPAALERVRATAAERLVGEAEDLGLLAAPFAPREVVLASWAWEKCRFGCAGYGRGGQCPPRSPRPEDTEALLAGYEQALVVRGEPPGAEFHRRMLALERAAFLAGHPRALAFVAGPCRLCPACDPADCAQPKLARPSLEASGVDVFATAARAGWELSPLAAADDPVTYVGLLLLG